MKWLRNLIARDRTNRVFHDVKEALRSDPFLKQAGITDEALEAAFEETERMRREDPELDRLYGKLARCNDWDEGHRLEREIQQRKLALQSSERSGGEGPDDEADEEDEEERLPLHRCDEAMTPEARYDAILVHMLSEDGLWCRRCGMATGEIRMRHARQVESYRPLGNERKVDLTKSGAYLYTAPNSPRNAEVIHSFSLENGEDELGLLRCGTCGGARSPRKIDYIVFQDSDLDDEEEEDDTEWEANDSGTSIGTEERRNLDPVTLRLPDGAESAEWVTYLRSGNPVPCNLIDEIESVEWVNCLWENDFIEHDYNRRNRCRRCGEPGPRCVYPSAER